MWAATRRLRAGRPQAQAAALWPSRRSSGTRGSAPAGDTGLRTVIDLRHPEELTENGIGPIESLEVSRLHLSVIDASLTIAENRAHRKELYGDISMGVAVYATWLDIGEPSLQAYFRALADPASLPVLVHCTTGKDRTGVLVGLTLALLGVSDEIIADDFALSQEYIDQFIEQLWRSGVTADLTEEGIRNLASIERDWMVEFLVRLSEQYGSVRDYLTSIGLEETVLDRVVANLTDN
jgi:protein-tyrosine phosphatase